MRTPLEIVVLNERDPEHPRAGGAEIHVDRLFSRLAARGHAVRWIASSFRGGAKATTIRGMAIERLGRLPAYYARVPFRVRRVSARSGRRPILVECLNKIPFYSPLYARVPILALCHHLFGQTAFDQVAWPIAAGVVAAERGLPRAYRDVPFLAISESTAADLTERGIARDHVRVSTPGIDRPRFDVDPDAARSARLTYFGRLEPYKHVDLMLEAAARLVDRQPDLEVVVIGEGSARRDLERTATRLGLDGRIRFTGFVDDDERDALVAGSRVCAFPSAKEGWGLTVIEANALGTPVVARDAPGLRDSVREGETGWLVPSHAEREREIDAWVRALAPPLARAHDEEGFRQRCLDGARGHDWDRAADETEAALFDALGVDAA